MHGKGKVGQAVVPGQLFAQQTDGAGVDAGLGAAHSGARHSMAQPLALTQGLHPVAALGVYVVAMRGLAVDVAVTPGLQVALEVAVGVVKERPVEFGGP